MVFRFEESEHVLRLEFFFFCLLSAMFESRLCYTFLNFLRPLSFQPLARNV